MKVQLTSYSGEKPEAAGSAWLAEDGAVMFSDVFTKELCTDVAEDAAGPVPVEEGERFLRSLPRCISGSALRAELIEP